MVTRDVKRYPVGIQSFEEIRTSGYLYVDKTAFVWRLAHENGKSFFLSRPRRFGKSLLLSTMQAYFEGRRSLFEGLALDGLESIWEKSPVIRLDMSTVKARTVEKLEARLEEMLRAEEEALGLEPFGVTLAGTFEGIIRRACRRSGKQVVVLVDEYDAPLLNVVEDAKLLHEFRQVMRDFYSPLKACDDDLRFVFLTGITKFSQLSIFSELNNLRNISMEPTYADLCGITEEELHTIMGSDVHNLADELGISDKEAFGQLKAQYDGYHFCLPSPDIYNPFSLLMAFAKGRIGSWWFETGTPSSLVRLLNLQGITIADISEVRAATDDFDTPTEVLHDPLPLLYQAGYLTIRAYDAPSDLYVLGIPNREVALGLSSGLIRRSVCSEARTSD